jgi:hypothetical protein
MLIEFVTTHREEIIWRCKAKVATRGEDRGPACEMEHGVPRFIDELVDELRLKGTANPEIKKTATKHGRDLLHQGFTLSQVVHGYGDVCQAITEMAVELKAPISADDFRLLNRALDDAIAAAVTEYSHERDDSFEEDAADETKRIAALAHTLKNSIQTARVAFGAIRSGRVGIAGSTGTVLDQNLLEADALIERLLAAEVFAVRRTKTTAIKATATKKTTANVAS